MSVSSSACSSRKTSEDNSSQDWGELSQNIDTFGLGEEQVQIVEILGVHYKPCGIYSGFEFEEGF